MPATPLTPITKIGPYPALPVAADSLDITWTVGDAANTNSIDTTSKTTRFLLEMRNVHATLAKTVTITSVADSFNRTGDITAYSIGALQEAHFYFNGTDGWLNGSNQVIISPQDTNIEFRLWNIS